MYQNFTPYSNPFFTQGSRFMMPPMDELELARAYIVRQPYTALFPLSEALHKGTIFPNLYMPYTEK